MKTLTASILALSMAAPAALAQSAESQSMQGTGAGSDLAAMQGELIRTRDITGGTIFTMNAADDEGWDNADYDTVGTDWNAIGEIEDIVLSQDGQMIGIVGEVGGFLDIADKHVLIPVEDVQLVSADAGEYAYVTRMNEEELEALPEVDEGFWE